MKRRGVVVAIALLGFVIASVGFAANAGDSPPPPAYRVLLVDGTKTLASTMRVVGLAGGIRQSGVAELTVLFADGGGPFDDPLRERERPSVPYDLILIVPRGIDDGTASRIWILVAGNPAASDLVSMAVGLLGQGVDLAFSGVARAVGPLDDLWAALSASLYVQQGWLR